MVDPQLIGGRQPVAPSAIAARVRARDAAGAERRRSGRDDRQVWRRRRRAILAGFDGSKFTAPTPTLFSSSIRQTPTSATTNGAAAATIAPVLRWRFWISPIKWPPVRRRCLYHRLSLSPEEMEVLGIRFDDTMYLLENWPPAASIICTSR